MHYDDEKAHTHTHTTDINIDMVDIVVRRAIEKSNRQSSVPLHSAAAAAAAAAAADIAADAGQVDCEITYSSSSASEDRTFVPPPQRCP